MRLWALLAQPPSLTSKCMHSVYWQVAVMVIIIFPLMMLRKMDSLKVSRYVRVG